MISGTISVVYGAALGAMYSEFSQALSRYTHNLLARNTLSEALQNTLLQHLGISPWSTETPGNSSWPLQVYPRTLSVLAQVITICLVKITLYFIREIIKTKKFF